MTLPRGIGGGVGGRVGGWGNIEAGIGDVVVDDTMKSHSHIVLKVNGNFDGCTTM